MPWGPSGPVWPAGPCMPAGPEAPGGPVGPLAPGGPGGPVAPVLPVAPVVPVAPVFPMPGLEGRGAGRFLAGTPALDVLAVVGLPLETTKTCSRFAVGAETEGRVPCFAVARGACVAEFRAGASTTARMPESARLVA